MIALDTNVLLRFLWINTNDPESVRQGEHVRNVMQARQGEGFFISIITLAEVACVLGQQRDRDGRKLMARPDIAAHIGRLIASRDIGIQNRDQVEAALRRFETGSAGLADYLIAELGHAAGASTTVTFDQKAARSAPDRFTLLSA